MDLEDYFALGRLDDSFPLPVDRPFPTAAALLEGVSQHQLGRLEQAGVIRRPVLGAYASSHLPDSVELRARCLRLVVPEDCVVVDRHAGWLLGAEMVLAPGEHLGLRPLSLFRPSGHGRLRNKLSASGERNLTADDVMEVDGIRVTTPIRTAWDLGRVRWPDAAISGIDAMLRLNVFSTDEFLHGIRRFRGMRWVTTLRAIGPLGDGRSESPGESVLRLRCIECGLTCMTPQLRVFRDGRLLARLDLGHESSKVGAEYDGVEWHSTPDQRAHDMGRRGEVGRDGWLVEPFTGIDVFGRARECDRKLGALRQLVMVRTGRAG